MCRKCRNIIRERAINKQMEQENIPVEMRAIFERGAKFGELQAALFLEKMVRKLEDDTVALLAVMTALGEEQLDRELTSLTTMRAVYQEQFEEGSAITFGKTNRDTCDKVNVLREVHALPLMDVAREGDEPKPGYAPPMAQQQKEADGAQLANDLLAKILAHVTK